MLARAACLALGLELCVQKQNCRRPYSNLGRASARPEKKITPAGFRTPPVRRRYQRSFQLSYRAVL